MDTVKENLIRLKPINKGNFMYYNELQIGMSVEIDTAVIQKDKMFDFAFNYDNIP